MTDWGEEREFDLHNATEKEVEDRVRELTLMGEKMVRLALLGRAGALPPPPAVCAFRAR
jgi:hypothetical protein